MDSQIADLITSQVGFLLDPTMLADLIDAVTTEIHMILGNSFTVENESATQISDALVPIIASAQDILSSDEINHLAQNLGTMVITEAALAAANATLQNDGGTLPTIVPTLPMTTENLADYECQHRRGSEPCRWTSGRSGGRWRRRRRRWRWRWRWRRRWWFGGHDGEVEFRHHGQDQRAIWWFGDAIAARR